jgi:BRCT domain type II-containing protein
MWDSLVADLYTLMKKFRKPGQSQGARATTTTTTSSVTTTTTNTSNAGGTTLMTLIKNGNKGQNACNFITSNP